MAWRRSREDCAGAHARAHQADLELVSRLVLLPSDSPERQRLLNRVVELLREDVRDEEDLLLPRLQMKLGVGQLRTVGVAWEAVRWIAPTRASDRSAAPSR